MGCWWWEHVNSRVTFGALRDSGSRFAWLCCPPLPLPQCPCPLPHVVCTVDSSSASDRRYVDVLSGFSKDSSWRQRLGNYRHRGSHCPPPSHVAGRSLRRVNFNRFRRTEMGPSPISCYSDPLQDVPHIRGLVQPMSRTRGRGACLRLTRDVEEISIHVFDLKSLRCVSSICNLRGPSTSNL